MRRVGLFSVVWIWRRRELTKTTGRRLEFKRSRRLDDFLDFLYFFDYDRQNQNLETTGQRVGNVTGRYWTENHFCATRAKPIFGTTRTDLNRLVAELLGVVNEPTIFLVCTRCSTFELPEF